MNLLVKNFFIYFVLVREFTHNSLVPVTKNTQIVKKLKNENACTRLYSSLIFDIHQANFSLRSYALYAIL